MRRTLLAVVIAMLLSMMVILAKISPPKIYLFEERNGSQSYPFSLTHLGMKPPTKLLALLVLHFGMMWHAKAATITYDVGNSNFSFLADSFVNNTFSGIIDVPVGGSKIGTLQSGEFRVEFGPSGST